MHLEHRHVEKMTHYEGSARIPLIVAGPGISHGITETRLTSLLDVFPTLLDVAGVSPPLFLPALDGYSLLPLIPGVASHDHRQRPAHVAAMAASDSLNAGQFMLRKGGYKYIAYATGSNPAKFAPQLFDIGGGDIWEMDNIAASHASLCAEMDTILRSEIAYPEVMKTYEAQGHEWAHRWTAAFSGDRWKALLQVAYEGFTADDERKFVGWLKGGATSQ
jgi:arylsulfatase A-like enzyme